MSRRRHAEEHDAEHENAERWLLTYADMITLLMVLFIVLFALGQTDVRKFNAFKDSFRTTFIGPAPVLRGGNGVLAADNSVSLVPAIAHPDQQTPPVTPQTLAAAAAKATLADALAKLQAAVAAAGVASNVRFALDDTGLRVTITTDKVLFDVGSAALLPNGIRIIDAIAPTLAGLPNQVRVLGHTDDQPILPGGPYPTNWELSTARATAVLRYLISPHHVAPTRLAASGYADTRPLVADDSAAHRAVNRRVEVLVEPTTALASS